MYINSNINSENIQIVTVKALILTVV